MPAESTNRRQTTLWLVRCCNVSFRAEPTMSDLDHDAWTQDNALPGTDGPALDDQAALAFEIAAMRVRASWDDLEAPAEFAPSPIASAPIDPFAPIVPAAAPAPPFGRRRPRSLHFSSRPASWPRRPQWPFRPSRAQARS